jgi:hypothetical protein
MSLSYRDERAVALRRATRGSGSARERRPGVWEVRVVVGFDAGRSRSVQKSFTVYGDHAAAARRRAELVEAFGVRRVERSAAAATLTLGELLERYVEAPHAWAPASLASARYVVGTLSVDRVAGERLVVFTPGVAQQAIRRWQQAGVSVATVSARWLVIRSALSWACAEGLLRFNPLAGTRGPARPAPRRHHTVDPVLRPAPTAARPHPRQPHHPPAQTRRRRLSHQQHDGNGRAARTSVTLTPAGRTALDTYTTTLRNLLGGL